jgi:hypothetical protein
MTFNSLPADLVSSICKFLSDKDVVSVSRVSSTLRSEASRFLRKRETVFKLKQNLIQEYLKSAEFREKIDSLNRFICVDLSKSNVQLVHTLKNVHTLVLRKTKVVDVSALGKVHTLNLSQSYVTDVSALGKVHTLDLS